MAYELHIERQPYVSLDEWKLVVANVPHLRLDEGPTTIVNPTTGDRISIGGREGDVSAQFGSDWHKVFRFSDRRISFNAKSINEQIAKTALALAQALQARIVGDEGEEFRDVERMIS